MALAGRSVAAAICLGAAVVALTLFGVQAIVSRAPSSGAPVSRGPAPLLLLGGTLAGLTIAAAVAWRMLRPVPSWYRRGGLALVSAFGTFVVAVLATPLYHVFGPASLLVLAGFGGATGIVLLRRGSLPAARR